MIHFVVPAEQDFGIVDYLAVWGRHLQQRIHILHYEDVASRTLFDRGTYVFAALDQLGPAMLSVADYLHHALSGVDGVRVLNHPKGSLQRFELLSELGRLNENDFRAASATENMEGLRYPVFIREEHGHGGPMSPLLWSAVEVEAAIGRALLRGHLLRHLIVVEFCDTADERGYYRKYAAFIVGDRIIARSLAYGRGWILKHGGIEFSAAMLIEERNYVFENPHEGMLRKIFAIARVDYGRIDYALKAGRIQTWEINLNPTIGRGLRPSSGKIPEDLAPLREETKQCFYRRFGEALEVVDMTWRGPPIRVVFRSLPVHDAHSNRSRRRLLATVWKVLRPLKPLLEPLGTRMLPLVGRLARKRDSQHS
ncbi:MAG: hypothetical protein ABR543_01740 [Gemmatimonadaceae bacterium]